jgi:hypothetical protein
MSLFHGISGNGNNFVTEKECYNTCSGENPLVSTVQYRTFDEDHSGIYLASFIFIFIIALEQCCKSMMFNPDTGSGMFITDSGSGFSKRHRISDLDPQRCVDPKIVTEPSELCSGILIPDSGYRNIIFFLSRIGFRSKKSTRSRIQIHNTALEFRARPYR